MTYARALQRFPRYVLPLAAVLAAVPAAAHAQGGKETRVNTYTSGRQQDPALATNANGQFLVAWASLRRGFNGPGIYGQMLNPSGELVGGELQISQDLVIGKVKPTVAFAPDGTAWVVWTSLGEDGDQGGIYARRLGTAAPGKNAEYLPLGNEFVINESTAGDQRDPALVIDSAGRATVAWVTDSGANRVIAARRFQADGTPLGGEIVLGELTAGSETIPGLAALGDDAVMAVWARAGADGRSQGIFGRILDGHGAFAGPEFLVNPLDGQIHVEPSIASNGRDLAVVSWMRSADGNEYGALARVFDAKHNAWEAPYAVEAGGRGYRTGAMAVMAADGTVAVAYNDIPEKQPGDSRPVRPTQIRARAYDRSGTALGKGFQVNRYDEGEQTLQVGLSSQRAVWSQYNQLAVVWHGNVGDDQYGIGFTLFQPPIGAMAGNGWPGASIPPSGPPAAGVSGGPDLSVTGIHEPMGGPVTGGQVGGGQQNLDFGFLAISDTGWYPPDPDLAVGPNHIVAVVNGQIAFFNKSGTNSFRQTLQQFWSSVGANSFVFDPQALYDPLSGRFCVAATEHANNGDDVIDIAVSDDSDPNGTWYKYRFNFSSVGDFIDFPNLGVGTDAFFVTADNFGFGGNYIYTFPKAPMLTGGAVTPKTKQTAGGSLLSLATMTQYDAVQAAQYFVTAWTSSTQLRIYALTNVLGATQTLQNFNLTVGTFSGPPDAQQQGSSNRADTIDTRTKNGVVISGRLYVCHNVASTDGQAANVRWYEIDLRGWPTSGNTPTLLQSGRINPGSNIDTWFGSIAADSDGNVAIAYNQSSPSQFIGINRTYHADGDPAGVTAPGEQQQISTSAETGSRWGDYSGIEIDPTNGTFWNLHEYRTTSWRTWAANFDTGAGGGGCGNFANVISLSGPTIGFPNQNLTYTFTNCPPNAPWFFYYSLRNTGTTINGHVFDIGSPFFTAGTGTTDGSGNGSLVATVPSNASGVTAYLEVRADDSTGASCDSNMITLVIF